MDISNAQTISGLVKKIFRFTWYKHNKYIIFNLSHEEDTFIRKTFRGGMSQCNFIGTVVNKKLYYFDVTSFYPWVGTFSLPFGKSKYVKFSDEGMWWDEVYEILRKEKMTAGFFRCMVKGT